MKNGSDKFFSQNWGSSMRLLLIVVLAYLTTGFQKTASASPLPEYDTYAAKCQEFWLNWNNRNERVQTELEKTTLLVDPLNHRIQELDRAGNIVAELKLPESRNWKALHISREGVAEIPLPYHIQWVHSNEGRSEWVKLTCLDTRERKPHGKVRFSLLYGPQVATTGGFGLVASRICYSTKAGEPKSTSSILVGIDRSRLNYQETASLGTSIVTVNQIN